MWPIPRDVAQSVCVMSRSATKTAEPTEMWFAVWTHEITKNHVQVGAGIPSRVAWWRNGRGSDLRSRGREFDPRPRRGCILTLGKLFAPNCLDGDTLR